jgi:thymidylate kinase
MSRRMFTVALVGADGAGKTTVGRRLESGLAIPAKYLYMGINAEASNHLLPTTRALRAVKRLRGIDDAGGPPDPAAVAPLPTGAFKRAVRGAKSGARLLNTLAEEWHRALVAARHVRRGEVVLFDRHFYADYYSHDVAVAGGRPLSRRLHGLALAKLYPKPDLVVFLDAPPEVLLARKGEGTLATLASRRDEYLRIAEVSRHFATVDATRTPDEVAADVAELIHRFARERSPAPSEVAAEPA